MPAGLLVKSAQGATPFGTRTQRQHLFQFADGSMCACWGFAGQSFYATQQVGGSWTAPRVLTNVVGVDAAPHAIVQSGDSITLWASAGSILYVASITGSSMTQTIATWNYDLGQTYGASTIADLAVVMIGSTWYIAVAFATSRSAYSTVLVALKLFGGGVITLQGSAVLLGSGAVSRVEMTGDASSLTAALVTAGKDLLVVPITVSGLSAGSAEDVPLPPSGLVGALAVTRDASGNLDLIYTATGSSITSLYAQKRLGSASYSGALTIAYNISSVEPQLSLLTTSGGDLWVYRRVTANQANGEVFVQKRVGGSWDGGSLAVGGDASGYSSPSAMSTFASNGTANLLYMYGSGSSRDLYALTGSSGAAPGSVPNTPSTSSIIPAGNITTLTPNVSWGYSNPVPSDLQNAYRIVITRVSDSVVIKDTGRVTGGSQFVGWPGGTLVYGIQYSCQIQVWDTVLGSASALSSASLFTPVQAPAPTLGSIADGTATHTTFPATIENTTLTVTGTHHQAAANAANGAQLLVYDSGGSNLVGSGTVRTLSPTVGDGAGFTLPAESLSFLANGSTYQIQVQLKDAVTGVWGASTSRQGTIAFVAPAGPIGFSADAICDEGYVQLAWSNPAPLNSRLYRRTAATASAGAGSWTMLATTTGSRARDFCAINEVFDYAVTFTDSRGLESAKMVAVGVTLLPRFGMYGHWYQYQGDPITYRVALGAIVDWASATDILHNTSSSRYVPQGRSRPIATFGLDDWLSASRRYLIPGIEQSTTGQVVLRQDVWDACLALEQLHGPHLYRDPTGNAVLVTIEKLLRGVDSLTFGTVAFEWYETDSLTARDDRGRPILILTP